MEKYYQKTFDFHDTGRELRNKGMQAAEETANEDIKGWSGKFYDFLVEYAKNHGQFMAEEVRLAAERVMDMPINKRATGGIFARAARNGIIKSLGKRNVSNPKAHCANAELWAYNND